MNPQKKSDEKRSWQAALDQDLSRRLLRSKLQPGLIRHDLAGRILARSQTMVCCPPDATVLNQSHETGKDLSLSPLNPIFAQRTLWNMDREKNWDFNFRTHNPIGQVKSEAGPTSPRSPDTMRPPHQPLQRKSLLRTASSQSPSSMGPATGPLSESGKIEAAKSISADRNDQTKGVIKRRVNNAGILTVQRSSMSAKSAKPHDIHSAEPAIKMQHPGSEDSAEKTRSSNPKNMTLMPKTGLPSDTSLSPATGSSNLAMIQPQGDAALYQGSPHEKPEHGMTEQATPDIVSGNSVLRKPTASLAVKSSGPAPTSGKDFHPQAANSNTLKTSNFQPAIRRRGPNRHFDRSIQPKARSPKILLADPVAAKSKAAVKVPASSVATSSPENLGPGIQTPRLQRQTQPLAAEQSFILPTTNSSAPAPNTSQTEVLPRSKAGDPGSSIQQRYDDTTAGDEIQRKTAPFREISMKGSKPEPHLLQSALNFAPNKTGVISRQVPQSPLTPAENRKMMLVKPEDNSFGSAGLGDQGINPLNTSNGYHLGSPLVMANSAASGPAIQTKPENTPSGSSRGPQNIPNISDFGERTISDRDLDSGNEIDLDELVNKVKRRLMRQLAIEKERRGKLSWR